ncbi:MAG: ATP-dependent sacrificial sulfur transferase LarE, partial [Gemmatimonadales bacterium]
SRVAHGLSITPERLRQVEEGEEWLRAFGVTGDLRVRHHASRARLEVNPEAISRLRDAWTDVEFAFNALGFTSVELDPRGYRRGSMLEAAAES